MQELKINWVRISRDIGGKYLLDRTSLILIVPFLIVVSVLSASSSTNEPDPSSVSSAERYLGLILANILSIIVCWLFLEMVDRTLFRNKAKKPISLIWVLTFGASIGFLKGLTTGLFSWVAGSDLDLEMAVSNRVVQTTILGVWTIPLISLVASTFAKYQAERQMLLAELIEQALRGPLEPLPTRVSADLRSFIAASKVALSTLSTDSNHINENLVIARKLRDLVDTGLRPISHKIWESQKESVVGFSIARLALLAQRSKPFPLLVIGVGFGIGIAPINFVAHPLPEAFVRTVSIVALVVLIFALAKIFLAHRPAIVLSRFLLANLLAAVVPPVVTDLIVAGEVDWNQLPAWAALFLWLLQLSFFASIASEVLASRTRVRNQLLELVGESGIQSEVKLAISKLNNRELAQYVHSNLQNKLLSCASKLEQPDISSEEIMTQLREVESILDGALDDYRSNSKDSLESQLQELVDRWAGFVNISFSLSIDPAVSPQTAKTIIQTVSEGVSNSVRHGFAKNVEVSLEKLAGEEFGGIQITLRDDGLGPRAGKPGLGTELFAAVSGGDWSVSQLPNGGSQLNLKIRR